MSQSPDQNDAYEKSLRFLYDRINYEKMASGTARYPFRLHRTRELLARLGLGQYLHPFGAIELDTTEPSVNPGVVPSIPLVHIAGTKGKGSTATMVASILSASGLRTGLYTSPHLNHLEERFRIDNEPCSRKRFIELIDLIAPVADQLEQDEHGTPSFFELTTAVAILHFHTQACNAIVLEVGLGGRLDSTNVCLPSVTAITSIGLDHQHVLGDTLGEIAAEKAGIIKPGIPVVSGVRGGEAAGVIARRADERSAPLFQLGQEFDFDIRRDEMWGSHVNFCGKTPLPYDLTAAVPLEGDHQTHNASLAIATIGLLRQQGLEIGDDAVAEGLSQVRCPGRIERFQLPRGVSVIVDAAHNEDSVSALCQCLQTRHDGEDGLLTIVFGTSRDKSAELMLKRLYPLADRLILTRFEGNPRFTPTKELLPLIPKSQLDRVFVVDNPIQACRQGLESVSPNGTMVVCGSFFLAAETRPWVAAQQCSTDASQNRD